MPSHTTTDGVIQTRSFALEAARLLQARRCDDIQLIEVRGLSSVCDYILIATGTSDRQMRTLQRELTELGKEHGHIAFRADADTNATWIIVDFVDLVVNLFEPNMRMYYDLETLWSDGRSVDWQRELELEPSGRTRSAADEDEAASATIDDDDVVVDDDADDDAVAGDSAEDGDEPR